MRACWCAVYSAVSTDISKRRWLSHGSVFLRRSGFTDFSSFFFSASPSTVKDLHPHTATSVVKMTRGNQREKAREKNAKKSAQEKKKLEGDPKKRMEAHADIMRAKQKAGKFFCCPSTLFFLAAASDPYTPK